MPNSLSPIDRIANRPARWFGWFVILALVAAVSPMWHYLQRVQGWILITQAEAVSATVPTYEFDNVVMAISLLASLGLIALALLAGRGQKQMQQAFLAMEEMEADRRKQQSVFATQLRTSEERLRLANQAAGIGTFIMDLRTGRVTFSSEAAVLLGFAADSEPTIEDAVKQCVHPDDLPPFHDAFMKSLDPNGKGLLKMDIRIVHLDGSMRWLAFLTKVEFEDTPEGRRPFLQIGTCMDITERRQAQELLARNNSDLEQKITERTSALEAEMRQRIEVQAELAHVQRLEAVGQMTGGLAHDFNNLLTVISANLELATLQIQAAEARHAIQQALDAVEIGANLNRRLLSFARERRLEPALFAINRRVEDMAMLLKRTLGEAITMRTDLSSDLHLTCADPGELDHAILNIALNARDAMPKGGLLTIETANVMLGSNDVKSMPGLQEGEYIHLSFTDTGVGMTPNDCARAVEPFFTTKEAGQGSGLGLSSVYGFVKQSGGYLRLSSELGAGTKVSIYLPRVVAENGVMESAHKDAVEIPLGDGQMVLLVEDNARVREATIGLIEGLGYSVLSAGNGAEAINLLRSGEPIDLLFSDVVMPGGMTGHELAQRASRARPEIKILITSGHNAAGMPDTESGKSFLLLSKPYSRARLARALHDALGGGPS